MTEEAAMPNIELIEVTNNDFPAKVREIEKDGGHIENTDWISGGYLLRVRWSLRWHFGPTDADPEPAKMWCYNCGGLVMWIKYGTSDGAGSFICLHCQRTSDE